MTGSLWSLRVGVGRGKPEIDEQPQEHCGAKRADGTRADHRHNASRKRFPQGRHPELLIVKPAVSIP